MRANDPELFAALSNEGKRIAPAKLILQQKIEQAADREPKIAGDFYLSGETLNTLPIWQLLANPEESIDWHAHLNAAPTRWSAKEGAQADATVWRIAMIASLSHRWQTLLDIRSSYGALEDVQSVIDGQLNLADIRGVTVVPGPAGEVALRRPLTSDLLLASEQTIDTTLSGLSGQAWANVLGDEPIPWSRIKTWADKESRRQLNAIRGEAVRLYRQTRRAIIRAVESGVLDALLDVDGATDKSLPSPSEADFNDAAWSWFQYCNLPEQDTIAIACDPSGTGRQRFFRPIASVLLTLTRRTRRLLETASDTSAQARLQNRTTLLQASLLSITRQTTSINGYWGHAAGDERIPSLLAGVGRFMPPPISAPGLETGNPLPGTLRMQSLENRVVEYGRPTIEPASQDGEPGKGLVLCYKKSEGLLLARSSEWRPSVRWDRLGGKDPSWRIPARQNRYVGRDDSIDIARSYVNPDRFFTGIQSLASHPFYTILANNMGGNAHVTSEVIFSRVSSIMSLHARGQGPHPASAAGIMLSGIYPTGSRRAWQNEFANADDLSSMLGRSAVALLQAEVAAKADDMGGVGVAALDALAAVHGPHQQDWTRNISTWRRAVNSRLFGTGLDPEQGAGRRCQLPPSTFLFLDAYLRGEDAHLEQGDAPLHSALLNVLKHDINAHGTDTVDRWLTLLPGNGIGSADPFYDATTTRLANSVRDLRLIDKTLETEGLLDRPSSDAPGII